MVVVHVPRRSRFLQAVDNSYYISQVRTSSVSTVQCKSDWLLDATIRVAVQRIRELKDLE